MPVRRTIFNHPDLTVALNNLRFNLTNFFNYDFRRTEMCIIPYGTQEGEISFCAYNTGIGWRNIIEHMHQNATVAQWYKEHGRHEVFARGKEVGLSADY